MRCRLPTAFCIGLPLLAGCGGPQEKPPGSGTQPPDGTKPVETAPVKARPPRAFSSSFDEETAGRLPAGFAFLTAGPASAAGVWKVEAVQESPSGAMALSCSPKGGGQADRLAVAIDSLFTEGVTAVALRPEAAEGGSKGEGGLLLRYRDPANYLALRLDFAANAAALTRTAQGKTETLAKGSLPEGGPWRRLAAECKGASIRCLLDGKPLLEAKEKTPASGKAGMLVRGSARILFDDFSVEPK